MNEMRRLINLVESIENDPELLEEGLRDKILGAVAAAGIALGGQAAAETVFVYQDGDSLQTVEQFMDIPDDAPMAYAIDTDTMQIKMIKGDSPKPATAQAVNDPQAQADMDRFLNLHAGDAYLEDVKHVTLESGQRAIIGSIYTGEGNPLGAGKGIWKFLYTPTGLDNPYGGLAKFETNWVKKPDAFKEGKGMSGGFVSTISALLLNPNHMAPAMKRDFGEPVQVLHYDTESGTFHNR